jgi:hypothetical protein
MALIRHARRLPPLLRPTARARARVHPFFPPRLARAPRAGCPATGTQGDTLKMTVAFPSERELDRDYIFTYADFERELRDQEAVWVYHVDPLSKKNDAMSINRTISRDNSKPSKPSAHFVFDLARVRYDESLNPKCAVKTQPSYDYASCELKVERAVSEVRPYTGSVGLVPFSNRASKQYVDSTDLTQWPKSTNYHGVGFRGEDGDGMDVRLGQPCCTTKTLLPERLQVRVARPRADLASLFVCACVCPFVCSFHDTRPPGGWAAVSNSSGGGRRGQKGGRRTKTNEETQQNETTVCGGVTDPLCPLPFLSLR